MLPGEGTMLYRYCGKFLEYCRLADFSDRSMQALEIRLGKFRSFARTRKLKSIKGIKYLHLATFKAEFNDSSVHMRESLVWTLRQIYHFLSLHGYPQNIAKKLPYPKMEKTVPHFLTQDECSRLAYLYSAPMTPAALRRKLCAFQSLGGHSDNRNAIHHMNRRGK
jgi:site-specific recombinase XerD